MPTDPNAFRTAERLFASAPVPRNEQNFLAEIIPPRHLPHRPVRQEVAALFSALERRIYMARNDFARDTGKMPEEVWIGPDEARIIEAERNWQSLEAPRFTDPASVDRMMRGTVEDERILGLIVRRMSSPGVRVGTTTEG